MADMADINHQIINIFRKIKLVKELSDKELLAVNYLDQGFIDSLQIVEMITKLESHFNISFFSEELESAEFRTLGGVGELINQKLKHKQENKF